MTVFVRIFALDRPKVTVFVTLFTQRLLKVAVFVRLFTFPSAKVTVFVQKLTLAMSKNQISQFARAENKRKTVFFTRGTTIPGAER